MIWCGTFQVYLILAWFVLALLPVHLRGVGQGMGLLSLQSSPQLLCLGSLSQGRLVSLEASVRISTGCMYYYLRRPTYISFLACWGCGAEADLSRGTECRSKQHNHYCIVTGVFIK